MRVHASKLMKKNAKILIGVVVDEWYDLKPRTNKKDAVKGRLHLRLIFTPNAYASVCIELFLNFPSCFFPAP